MPQTGSQACNFPVFEPGALLFLGDGHALQGDGEVCGGGVEISMEVRVTVRVLKGKPIVSFHESLTYFADSFDLNIAGSIQIAPGAEVDGPRLARLAELCEKQGVRIITVEPQFPEGAAETLRKRLHDRGFDVKLVVVDPLETVNADELAPDWYEKKLWTNIQNLAASVK